MFGIMLIGFSTAAGDTKGMNLGKFFAAAPEPRDNPSAWRWPDTVANEARALLEITAPYPHFPSRTVAPATLTPPFSYREGRKAADAMRGQGGVAYINWQFGIGRIPDISIDFTLHKTLRPPGDIYLQLDDAPIGRTPQYFGLQCSFDHNGNPVTTFIWSRWLTNDTANAWVAPGGHITSLANEGQYICIGCPYKWGQGTYTVHLLMRETDQVGTWYEIRIFDHQTCSWTKAGRMRFPPVDGAPPLLAEAGASWLEIIGGTRNSRDIAENHISFGGAYTCGRTVATQKIATAYNDRECPNSDVSIDPDGRRVHLHYGGDTRRRTKAGTYPLKEELAPAQQ